MPQEGLNVSKYTVVCIKHFQECNITKYDLLPGKNGDPDVKISQKKLHFKRCFSLHFSKLMFLLVNFNYLCAILQPIKMSQMK